MIAGRKRHRHERMSGTFACARSRSGLVALSGQSGCPITALRPADKISSFPVLKIVSTVRGSPETNVCNATKLLVGSQLRVIHDRCIRYPFRLMSVVTPIMRCSAQRSDGWVMGHRGGTAGKVVRGVVRRWQYAGGRPSLSRRRNGGVVLTRRYRRVDDTASRLIRSSFIMIYLPNKR